MWILWQIIYPKSNFEETHLHSSWRPQSLKCESCGESFEQVTPLKRHILKNHEGLKLKIKRSRLVYTADQIKKLKEHYFGFSKYVIRDSKLSELSKKLDIPEKQIACWFQNQRSKEKIKEQKIEAIKEIENRDSMSEISENDVSTIK